MTEFMLRPFSEPCAHYVFEEHDCELLVHFSAPLHSREGLNTPSSTGNVQHNTEGEQNELE